MLEINKIKNRIIKGDTIDTLRKIPNESIDLIFADPPYFMQTEGKLLRPEGTSFKGVNDAWDKFNGYEDYDEFSRQWLAECKRVLKKNGSIWVIGSFQNIYRIGYIMQNLKFWILNDIVWSKPNPVPNFMGTRFTNANETLLWCSKHKGPKFTFNYKTMKFINNGKQMKSIWDIKICNGKERLRDDFGNKIHSTQKPESLLMNVILSSSKVGDIILDPFMGSGTTGVVAKETGRSFVGIEKEVKYIKASEKRIKETMFNNNNFLYQNKLDIAPPKVNMQTLIKTKYLEVDEIFYTKEGKSFARLLRNGYLFDGKKEASIHKMSANILKTSSNNGWLFWKVVRKNDLRLLNSVRYEYREKELGYENFIL